jgi:hypothetical protein
MDEDTVLHSLSLVEEKLEQVLDCLNIIDIKLTGFENKLNEMINEKNGNDRSSFAKRKVQQWLEITKK